MRVGITGQTGFVGTHLYNMLGLCSGIERILFYDEYFSDFRLLREFVKRCDVIVHLAAMNRHPEPEVVYEANMSLARRLIEAMEVEKVTPYVLFSSSTQEERENPYGKSKRDGRRLLEEWAQKNGASFTGLIIPNVFGPFARPGYNSFIATFCYRLTRGECPEVIQDSPVRLIYVGNLCSYVINRIETVQQMVAPVIESAPVPYDFEKKVTEVLSLLANYQHLYLEQGYIPAMNDPNEVHLFNTFCSYLPFTDIYPRKLTPHADERGVFVETLKTGVGGQFSFSTTAPGVTRGNHYHTRKIERFAVIRGKALVQLRKIGTDAVLSFQLDGSEPTYVDMPVWYTHNITNIGEEELYTLFWINEWYNPDDSDTYYEPVIRK